MTNFDGMTYEQIGAAYRKILRDAAKASDAVFDSDAAKASDIITKGDRDAAAFERSIKSFFFFRLPAGEQAGPEDRCMFYPLANGWRRPVDASDIKKGNVAFSPALRRAIAERLNGAAVPAFED